LARTPDVGAAGRVARQPARVRGDARLRARERPRARRAHADARHLLPHHRGGASLKRAAPLLALLVCAASPAADRAPFLFTDDFESHAAGQVPGKPWSEETYKSGAVITVDGLHAFSGMQAMHVFTPRGAKYRRGYVAIHLAHPVPAALPGMYGRAMV